MLLALGTMDPAIQAVFYVIAVVLFVLGAVVVVHAPRAVAAGLAFAFFVFFWNALAAA